MISQGPSEENRSIATLNTAESLLMKAETVDDVCAIRSQAEAIRVWAKNASIGLETQNRAAEIRLRAERKAGKLLASLNLRGGDRKSNGHHDRLSLKELGITQNRSKRWQKEASVPEDVFVAYLHRARELGQEIGAAALLRIAAASDRSRVSLKNSSISPAKQLSSATGESSYGEIAVQRSPVAQFVATEVSEIAQEIKEHVVTLEEMLLPHLNDLGRSLKLGELKSLPYFFSELRRLTSLLSTFTHDEKGKDAKRTG